MAKQKGINRRKFVQRTLVTAAGLVIAPGFLASCGRKKEPLKRVFGKIGFEVTTLGLGGQASIQWTPEGIDPVKIILKAFDLGINYFDTSNVYGPSQINYGKAFRIKNLIPGEPGYDNDLRKSIFLTTKTHLRYAKGGSEVEGVRNATDGEQGTHAVDDLKRTLSQIFGNGNGSYPEGSYVDMILFHNLNTKAEVDAIFEGLENPDPSAERLGALVALKDFRDGTNLTGLNPGNEKLIRHIGFSGHFDPSVNMYMIQRDRENLLDAVLLPVNANDKQMFNMQNNVLPLAIAKNMGVIAMKVFADGAMYTKPAEWSRRPEHVVLTTSDHSLPSHQLVRYSLTTPGVHVAIIGTGHISDNYYDCQMSNNFDAAQVLPGSMDEKERADVEMLASKVKDGKTNYFQRPLISLTAPSDLKVVLNKEKGNEAVITWNTAFAADAPLEIYEIWRDGAKISEVPFTPQITTDPYVYTDILPDKSAHKYSVRIIDAKGKIAESIPVELTENLS